jgi:hypothetical protein
MFTNLSNVNLFKADLDGANLHEANLSNADLNWANLSNADLSKANLSKAILSNADLSKANLFRANLEQTKVIGTRFVRSNISEAIIENNPLWGAILEEPVEVKQQVDVREVKQPVTSSTAPVIQPQPEASNAKPSTRLSYEEDLKKIQVPSEVDVKQQEVEASKQIEQPEEKREERSQPTAGPPFVNATDSEEHSIPERGKYEYQDIPVQRARRSNTRIYVIMIAAIVGTFAAAIVGVELHFAWLYQSYPSNPSNSSSPATSPAINQTTTPPTAENQSVTISENTEASIPLRVGDKNPNANLTATIVKQPSHGMLRGQAPSYYDGLSGPPDFAYTPNQNFTGSDNFRFKVNDGKVDSNIATVNITVCAVRSGSECF